MTRLLNLYAARKKKRRESAEREADQAKGSNRPTKYGGSEMQVIVIPSLPEMGSSDQLGSEGVALGEPREVTPIPPALQVIHPPDRAESRLDTAKLARAGRKKSLPPDRILLNSYPSWPSSCDGGSDRTRARRNQAYYPPLETF